MIQPRGREREAPNYPQQKQPTRGEGGVGGGRGPRVNGSHTHRQTLFFSNKKCNIKLLNTHSKGLKTKRNCLLDWILLQVFS